MKFVWKDDVVSSVTDELYTVRDDENNIVYRGIVPEYDLFYLNRVAQKLMKRGTLDFTSGVTQHPDMSIDLTLFDTQDVPVKSEVYINAFQGEYRPDLSNPINGKLDPRMMFLWTAYNERTTQYVINGEQPEPPAFYLNLSGVTSFTYNQQTSVIAADCSDWDAVDIVRTGSWFFIIKTRNGLTLSIDRNTTDSARTGTLDFYYGGSVYTSMTLSQEAEAAPSSFVLEFSGSTYFNFIPDIHMLYVVDCTDWNGVTIGQEGDWFIPTKTTDGVAIDVDTNFEDNARTGALKCYYNGILVKTVNLTQGVYSFTIEMSGNTVFDYQQQTGELAVVQCTDWANTDLQQIGDWFVATKTNTGITIQLQENDTDYDRNGSIQLYYDSGEYGLVYEATVTQNQFVLELEISGQTLFDYTEQESVLSAVCNDWSGIVIEKMGEWFNYTKTESGITLNISKNNDNETKTGLLTLSYESEVVSAITLSQEAFVLELEISGNTSFDYTQQTAVLSAICNDWSGVLINPTSGWFDYVKTDTGITLGINENTSQETRYGFLTLTYNSQVVRIIALSQEGAEDFALILSGETSFDYTQQISVISVVQCTDWNGVSITPTGEWFSATKTDTGITLSINENTSLETRYGFLTLLHNSQVVRIITLSQTATESFVLEMAGSTSFSYIQQVSVLSVVECTDWSGVTIISTGDWFNATKTNTGITLSINENTTYFLRTGTISYIYNSDVVKTTVLTQYEEKSEKEFFTTVAQSDGLIRIKNTYPNYYPDNTLLYRINGGEWHSGNTASQGMAVSVSSGDVVEWKNAVEGTQFGYNSFSGSTALFEAKGNIMSLAFGDNYQQHTSLVGTTASGYGNTTFIAVFGGCTALTNAEKLVLPATTLSENCYRALFSGCTSLVNAPLSLPATYAPTWAYESMFDGCASLVNAPIIHMTEMAQQACRYMFRNCVSLVSAPELLATSLIISSYEGMFYGCSSLTFIKCLAESGMGSGQNQGTKNWTSSVAGNGTFVKKAGVSWPSGSSGIPNGWTVQEVNY